MQTKTQHKNNAIQSTARVKGSTSSQAHLQALWPVVVPSIIDAVNLAALRDLDAGVSQQELTTQWVQGKAVCALQGTQCVTWDAVCNREEGTFW